MEDSFKVGDRVLVVYGPKAGTVTHIVEGPMGINERSWWIFWKRHGLLVGDLVFLLDIVPGPFQGTGIAAPPSWLVHAPGSQEDTSTKVERREREPA